MYEARLHVYLPGGIQLTNHVLVVPQNILRDHQARNRPSFIQEQNRRKLESEGHTIIMPPDPKKLRRGSLQPLETAPSPVPSLPEEFQSRQETLVRERSGIEDAVVTKVGKFHTTTAMESKPDRSFGEYITIVLNMKFQFSYIDLTYQRYDN